MKLQDLRNFGALQAEIKAIEGDLQEVEACLLGAVKYGYGGSKKGSVSDKTASKVSELDTIKRRLQRLKEKRVLQLSELNEFIARLPAEDAQLVRLHYIEGKSWKDVSRVLGCSEDLIYKRLGRIKNKYCL